MDRRTDWPWDWQEEAEWKAELEERDYDFVAGLIDDAVEDTTSSPVVVGLAREQESAEEAAPEEYLIAA